MNPERWESAKRLFHEALELPTGERDRFVREAAAGDAALRDEVIELLSVQTRADAAFADVARWPAGHAFPPGMRLGPYEIHHLIGVGGMGEVYHARDTRLRRDVAIKTLPIALAHDPERRQRAEREAHLLAALNHPNIAAIYGLEEVAVSPGSGQAGALALVLELVEGPTLADRIAHGPLAVGEALAIARQIADALEAAHERGIVHRDLKPANVKVTADGVVKVLDFGLAKAAGADSTPDLSQSPTLTVDPTRDGMILGTAAYMSPEQAKGRPVDKRADLWAFGALLYELLTGRQAFTGEGASDTLAKVLMVEPDWTALPASTPAPIRRLLRRCLEKDRNRRLADAADARLEIDEALASPAVDATATTVRARWRRVVLVALAAVIASGSIMGALEWVARPAAPPRVSRLQVTPSGAAALTISWNDRDLAITPDGSRLVYVGNRGTQIFVRALDALEPVAVFTGLPRGPFVSPDGQWIGFVDGLDVLKKVGVTGGPAETLATFDTAGPSGATWGSDGTIVVATNAVETGLQRVAAAGGPMTVLTRPDRAQGEADHFYPEMLPGNRAVLFTITALLGGLDAAQVAVLDLQSGKHRVLLRGGSHAHYVPSGHLVYAAAGTLRAVPFDLARLETRGTPVTVVPDVVTTSSGAVDAVVARDGTLAYVSGSVAVTPRTLVWVDRQGRETPIPAPPRPYLLPALSPDGTRVAVFANDQERDLWLWDLARTTLTRLTFTPGLDSVQVWTPDGRRLIFTSERAGVRNLYWQAADGTGVVERLTESPHTQYPSSVSPDGRRLIFAQESPGAGYDVMALELDGSRRVTPLLQSPFIERGGTLSPDGRWLAYEANDSGRFEIYVRPYPDVNSGRLQVSTTGGTRPIWPRSEELVYVSPTGALMGVGVARGPSWAATTPALLVKEGYFTIPSWAGRMHDISRDGQRFLMIKEGGADGTAAPASIIVVQHWVEELKRLVPTR